MSWVKFLFSFLFILSGPGTALADYSPEEWRKITEEYWEEYFPLPVVLPDPMVNLQKLIKDPVGCQHEMRQTIHDVFQYRKIALRSSADAKTHIDRVLENLKAGEKNRCGVMRIKAYSLASLTLLTAGRNESYKKITTLRYKASIALAGIAAVNTGRVSFIDSAARRTPGSFWNEHQTVLGTFACETNQIVIDPYQQPYNLGATLVHELEHLYFNEAIIAESFDPKALVIFDEGQAALHAAYLQREAATLIDKEPKKVTDKTLTYNAEEYSESQQTWVIGKKKVLTIPGDLSFYTPNKMADHLWTEREKMGFGGYQFRIVLHQLFYFYSNEIHPATLKLFNLISQTYFKETVQSQTAEQLTLSKLNKRIDDFMGAKEPGSWGTDSFYSILAVRLGNVGVRWSKQEIKPHSFYTANPKSYRVQEGRKTYFIDFSNLFANFPNATPSQRGACEIFHKAIEDGKLKNYPGAEEKDHHGGEGIRPTEKTPHLGGEGIRPTEKVKPCILIGDKL